jgi:integrase
MARRRSGSVIVYRGKRGKTFGIRYRDADGRRVSETLGSELEGWTEKRAEEALEVRRVQVRKEGRRKLEPVSFATFAREWVKTYRPGDPEQGGLKRSTREGYESIIEGHLNPELGALKLAAIDTGRLKRYVARKRQGDPPLQGRTINRHLNLLHLIFGAAGDEELVRSNPVSKKLRAREPRRRWTILSPVEICRVERTFAELADEAEGEERAWCEQARVVFLTVVSAGLRRGEILGLRWRHVSLADPAGALLRVEETWVRGAADTPKSEKSERTMALGERLASELFDHRGRTAYRGDDERVFCNPLTGRPLDPKRYAATLRLALKRAEIAKPMRPFHDGRHTSLTNEAASGSSPMALMAKAGHSDFATTQLYIDLAGEVFREEAWRLEERLFGTATREAKAL